MITLPTPDLQSCFYPGVASEKEPPEDDGYKSIEFRSWLDGILDV